MDEKEFLGELEKIEKDLEGMVRPCSPCTYFHGREKLFNDAQFKKAVEFFLESQEKLGERGGPSTAGTAVLNKNES